MFRRSDKAPEPQPAVVEADPVMLERMALQAVLSGEPEGVAELRRLGAEEDATRKRAAQWKATREEVVAATNAYRRALIAVERCKAARKLLIETAPAELRSRRKALNEQTRGIEKDIAREQAKVKELQNLLPGRERDLASRQAAEPNARTQDGLDEQRKLIAEQVVFAERRVASCRQGISDAESRIRELESDLRALEQQQTDLLANMLAA